MSLYDDLLGWSAGRPTWQRDALRRLAQQGSLNEQDLADLTAIAFGAHGAPGHAVAAAPLAAAHVPTAGEARGRVDLLAVASPANVNALAPGARLDFPAAGLTIVYGDNGAGKSGYVRILKRVCRARSIPTPVLPNVMRRDPAPTSAEIEFSVDGVARTRHWAIGDTTLDELGSVTVFDRECAAVYVSAENEVAYSPLGLDLLDSLAAAARQIGARLNVIRDSSRLTVVSPPTDLLGAEALVGVWPIDADTTTNAVAVQPPWDEAAEASLRDVQRALATPRPADAAAGLRARLVVLVQAANLLERMALDVGVATGLGAARAALRESERALEDARRIVADPQQLPGVGGPIWRALWAAAAHFSFTTAYVDHEFPFVGPDARCVLCEQDLGEAAKDRFQRLAEAVSIELEENLERDRLEVSRLEASLSRVRETAAAGAVVDELRAIQADEATRLQGALDLGVAWAGVGPDPADQDEATRVRENTQAVATSFRQRAALLGGEAELLRQAAEPVEAEALRTQARDLRARAWVAENVERIAADVDALRVRAAVGHAQADCDTRPITVESGRLTERYVTEALRQAFADELRILSSNRVRVRIVPRGQYGAVYHRLELDGAVMDDARVADVVSEGEFRAIALASFFAELGQEGSNSAVVLDDPVSSLDHLNREHVARRIVQEAGRRQVVVFTHDLVFLHDLSTAADASGVPYEYRRLRLTATHAGWAVPEPPWLGMKVRQRVEYLQQELNRIRGVFESGDIDMYEREARTWYGSLRETWERAVEEVLFGDTIGRYRHDVRTTNLTSKQVWLIDEQDVATVTAGMTRSSGWLRGHDQPAAVNQPVPMADELRNDLASLRDWVAAVTARRTR